MNIKKIEPISYTEKYETDVTTKIFLNQYQIGEKLNELATAVNSIISYLQEKEGIKSLRDNSDKTCNCSPLGNGCFFQELDGSRCKCKCHQEKEEKDFTIENRTVDNEVADIKDLLGENAVIDYEKNQSHYHCWNQKQPCACGIPLEKHTQCCLCDTKVPPYSYLDRKMAEFDESFYDGDNYKVMCKEHNKEASPYEIRGFIRQSILGVLSEAEKMKKEVDSWGLDENEAGYNKCLSDLRKVIIGK